ncbi:N-acetylglucosamine-6-phosphate deacetylase [Bifidobacterium pongonis]|uniref:N-acetylglucosamine-6-phosphate deacetylase n=1 Tax=Bifidobacterium pongonis TaxID=2834432 RepID=UPI001F2BF345|nr:N-acetylglucosamine-6-phosphate deacetylase [Bifidobacterium pongonis]
MSRTPERFAICNARRVDAIGVSDHCWVVCAEGRIAATGCSDAELEAACRGNGVAPEHVLDAHGATLTPGYIDIHAHGAWGCSFDDGADAIDLARAGHLTHGTTRQVLSLITNPVDVMHANLRTVREKTAVRPDILGAHLEGPFLAVSRKGAHDPAYLRDPDPKTVDGMLEAAGGCLRQITIAPELPHGLDAIRRFSAAGTVPAVGHCEADYRTARAAFEAGAGMLTHMFNAMNSLHHRNPGPIPAAVESDGVVLELIVDGFHVHDAMARLGFGLAPHRIAFVTDAMAATGCPDGSYRLGGLEVTVANGHARLASNGAIAGSTLTLEDAVRHAVLDLGISPAAAVEAATLTPAKALGLDVENAIAEAPLGLIRPGFAADLNLIDTSTWRVTRVWCAGRPIV